MTDEEPSNWNHHHGRSSLLGIMIVIVSCAVVVGVGYYGYKIVQNGTLLAQCGKHQANIVGAIMTFEISEKSITPDLSTGDHTMTANTARVVTCRKFEIVFASLSIPAFLAKCPASRFPAPKIKPQLANQGSQWGMAADAAVSYAYDWATPLDPSSARVILADRDPMAHSDPWMTTSVILACFGDAHVKKLKYALGSGRKPGALVTEGCDGQPVSVNGFTELGDDDLYSADGDGGDPLTPGAGDPLRAWVK